MDALTLLLAWISGGSGATLRRPWDEAGQLLAARRSTFDLLVRAGAPTSPPVGILPSPMSPLENAVQMAHSFYVTELLRAGAERDRRNPVTGMTAADILRSARARRKFDDERARCDRMLAALDGDVTG